MKLEWACIIRAPSEGDQRCLVSDFALSLRMVRRYDCRESVAVVVFLMMMMNGSECYLELVPLEQPLLP
jgi:hypothetical protein